ncbi:hypothetical protein BKA64DRAFT_642579 [Cadophora sp. MPI-SDFR-AT-0126]|nr:hypothetical protein BKA64DRAFT_642579 [Leotiomycetes sp. MPI-SDFR-AT-0126]
MTTPKLLALPFLSFVLYLSTRVVIWTDLFIRIFLAEKNQSDNSHKLSSPHRFDTNENAGPSSIACLVGYREDERLFEDALISYNEAGTKYLVVGVDGNSAEDEEMVTKPKRKTMVLRLSACVGQVFIQNQWSSKTDFEPKPQRDKLPEHDFEFQKAYDYMFNEVKNSGFLDVIRDTTDDVGICFTQPHRDLKEVRLAAWILSIVLKGVEYLWSSDSDTIVLPDTIFNLTKLLPQSPQQQTAYNCDAYLNRSALGAIGRSECLNGPGSLFRIAALRTVAASWHHCQYPASQTRTVLNEDMQVTMLLGKEGWRRLYSAESIIQTAGPVTLDG